jgi:hypothetical protein
VLTRLRSGRTGILLDIDPDRHAPLLHCSPPLREEIPRHPGRGWLVAPDGSRPVQLALP